jgi:predicted XRE-type DNA-binding protein
MLRRDPERLQRLRVAVRYLLTNNALERGHQARLAELYKITRQRVNQVIVEEEQRSGVTRTRRLYTHRKHLTP